MLSVISNCISYSSFFGIRKTQVLQQPFHDEASLQLLFIEIPHHSGFPYSPSLIRSDHCYVSHSGSIKRRPPAPRHLPLHFNPSDLSIRLAAWRGSLLDRPRSALSFPAHHPLHRRLRPRQRPPCASRQPLPGCFPTFDQHLRPQTKNPIAFLGISKLWVAAKCIGKLARARLLALRNCSEQGRRWASGNTCYLYGKTFQVFESEAGGCETGWKICREHEPKEAKKYGGLVDVGSLGRRLEWQEIC